MHQLQEALKAHADVADTSFDEPDSPLEDAAKKWAVHSLSTYSGKLLRRAMAVSVALNEFADEFRACTKGK